MSEIHLSCPVCLRTYDYMPLRERCPFDGTTLEKVGGKARRPASRRDNRGRSRGPAKGGGPSDPPAAA